MGADRLDAVRGARRVEAADVAVGRGDEQLPQPEEPAQQEGGQPDEFMTSLMTVEGIQLAKAFRDANSPQKRKLIAALARQVADSKEPAV